MPQFIRKIAWQIKMVKGGESNYLFFWEFRVHSAQSSDYVLFAAHDWNDTIFTIWLASSRESSFSRNWVADGGRHRMEGETSKKYSNDPVNHYYIYWCPR